MIFGHQNNTPQNGNNGNGFEPANQSSGFTTQPAFTQNPLAVDPATGASLPTTPPNQTQYTAPAPSEPATAPQADNSFMSDQQFDALAAEPPTSHQDYVQTITGNDENGASDLLSLKQQALQELSPLVDHLDQTPEEKFRTTMMMIQATDNQSLIPTAYEAAQHISDEKNRAQALLDLINEINYFTQHNQENPEQQ
jgi:hypothetical protein